MPQSPPIRPAISIVAIATTPLTIAVVVKASVSNHCGSSTFESTSYSLPSHAASPESAAARTTVHRPVISPFRAPS